VLWLKTVDVGRVYLEPCPVIPKDEYSDTHQKGIFAEDIGKQWAELKRVVKGASDWTPYNN
jgi:hypothetical protein